MKHIKYWAYLFLALSMVFIIDACAKKKIKDSEPQVISWSLRATSYDGSVFLLSDDPMFFFEKEVKIKFLTKNRTNILTTVGNIQDENKQINKIN